MWVSFLFLGRKQCSEMVYVYSHTQATCHAINPMFCCMKQLGFNSFILDRMLVRHRGLHLYTRTERGNLEQIEFYLSGNNTTKTDQLWTSYPPIKLCDQKSDTLQPCSQEFLGVAFRDGRWLGGSPGEGHMLSNKCCNAVFLSFRLSPSNTGMRERLWMQHWRRGVGEYVLVWARCDLSVV